MISYRDLMSMINIVGKQTPSRLNETLVVKKDSDNTHEFRVSCETVHSNEPKLILVEAPEY